MSRVNVRDALDERDNDELDRIEEHRRAGTATWEDEIRARHLRRAIVDRRLNREAEQRFKRRLGLTP